jgi:hypothetical protein
VALASTGCSGIGSTIQRLPDDAAARGYVVLPKPVTLPRGRLTAECVPESLCAVMNYWGKPASVEELSFFGRERDSITYLRYGLDVAFVRAYENGKPAATANFLKWSGDGVKEGDLVFASGNPAAMTRSRALRHTPTATPADL